MSHIDELIRRMAPGGVSYRPISDVASYVRGVTYSKNDEDSSGPIRVLRSNNISLSSNTLNLDEVRRVSATVRVRPDQRLKANDILVSAASGSKAHVGKVAYVKEDIDYCFGGFMAVLRTTSEVEPRFLFHLLTGRNFADYLDLTLTSTTINNLSSSIMGAFRIPVPPLEVQREIVRVLDEFTELEARQLQYLFYRGGLLSFGAAVPIVTLGEIATVGTGSHDTKDAIPGADYVFYARGRDLLQLDAFDFDETAIITAGDGAGVGKVFHFVGGKYALHQRAYRIVPKAGVNPRFIYFYLRTDFARYLERISVRGSVNSLRRPMFLNYRVPLPTLSEQTRIAHAIDQFEALVGDLTIGLQAEIAARRKQLGYYRDRLLTFDEASV